MHFDYCTTASIDFVMLDESSFSNILQVIINSSLYMNNMKNVAIFLYLNKYHHLGKKSGLSSWIRCLQGANIF